MMIIIYNHNFLNINPKSIGDIFIFLYFFIYLFLIFFLFVILFLFFTKCRFFTAFFSLFFSFPSFLFFYPYYSPADICDHYKENQRKKQDFNVSKPHPAFSSEFLFNNYIFFNFTK